MLKREQREFFSMNPQTQERLLAMETLIQESLGILPYGSMVPSGEVAQLVANWSEATMNPKKTVQFGELAKFAEALQRFRRIGLPVLGVMESMAAESMDHPSFTEGVKSDGFLFMAQKVVEDRGDLTERIGRFIWLKFGSYLCYDPRYGGISVLPSGSRINMSSGNYEHILITAIRREFKSQLTPAQTNAQWLQSIIQDSVRSYMAAETPIQELDRVYEEYQSLFPPLDPEKRPSLISEGQGNWGLIYKRLAALFEVYGILGKPREEELMTRSLLGIVARTYNPGEVMQWTMLLQGKGACGKSVLGQVLALDTAPAVVITPSDLGKSKTLESMAGSSVVVLDEMDVSVSKRDIAENKSFLSQTHSRIRRAYRRDAETIAHTWTVISTTNSETLPHDDGAEMRRYGLVRLSGGMEEGEVRARFLVENRRYLQALLVHLYHAGYPIDLGSDMIELNRETSRDLIEVPDEVSMLEGVVDSLAKLMVTGEGHLLRLTTKTVWQLISNDKFHPRRAAGLTRTLEERGWMYTRSRARGNTDHSKFWLPPNLPETIEVKAFHPDNLHTLRKAVAAQAVQTVKVCSVTEEQPTTPPKKVEVVKPPTTHNKDSEGLAPNTPGPLDPVAEKLSKEVQVKALKNMLKQAGVTPPDTGDIQELLTAYRACFAQT